jgi:hypothetical protein
MDEEVVDEVIELRVVLTARSESMAWKRHFELPCRSELVSSEREFCTDLVSLLGCPAEIGVELARQIVLDFSVDVLCLVLELCCMDDDLVSHKRKR